MITKFARLEFELFTRPSKSDFLRVYQKLENKKFCLPGKSEGKQKQRRGL
jgi:hypothetical protein